MFQKVANCTEIPVGSGKTIDLGEKMIGLFNIGGSFYAIDNTCPHRQGPLGDGSIKDNLVTCPWHGWTFDVTTGACRINPAAKVATYATKIEGDSVFVEI